MGVPCGREVRHKNGVNRENYIEGKNRVAIAKLS
jgi:hypothetical protein